MNDISIRFHGDAFIPLLVILMWLFLIVNVSKRVYWKLGLQPVYYINATPNVIPCYPPPPSPYLKIQSPEKLHILGYRVGKIDHKMLSNH